jgi:hypothetical protein
MTEVVNPYPPQGPPSLSPEAIPVAERGWRGRGELANGIGSRCPLTSRPAVVPVLQHPVYDRACAWASIEVFTFAADQNDARG